MLHIEHCETEYQNNPLGMDETRPRFSYRLTGDSLRQTARKLRVVSETGDTVWDSGWVETGLTLQIEYAGRMFQPFTRYDWTVSVRDENGQEFSSCPGEAFFETGFLGQSWTAEWIHCDTSARALRYVQRYVTTFRKDPAKKIRKARMYVTALGLYEGWINGKRVSEDCFTPGWTSYFHRVQYQAYDIAPLLRDGKNVFGSYLADGWYKGLIASCWAPGSRNTYGDIARLKVEFRLEYGDGTVQIHPSSTKTFLGVGDCEIRMSDIYMGERCEAGRLGEDHWKESDSHFKWYPAAKGGNTLPPPTAKEVWNSGPKNRHVREITPVSIRKRPGGSWIVDFGENITGRERFTVPRADRGACILVRHAETLREDGSMFTENLRCCWAESHYVCQGGGLPETYEPKFTYYGFRYAEITGWPGDLNADMIRAVVLSSDLKQTGSFSCSDPELTTYWNNVFRGQQDNFLDVPTDCPQRDERYGWSGDTQVFADAASFNMDCGSFYTKWLEDLNLDFLPWGAFPQYAPNPYADPARPADTAGATGWADAGLTVPFILYEKYADTRILRKLYPNMKRYLDAQVEHANGLPVKNARYGDWLNIDAPTPEEYLSTAYLGGMTRLLIQIAEILSDHAEAERRRLTLEKIRAFFQSHYLNTEKELTVKTQTAAAMAICFELVDGDSLLKTGKWLVHDIRTTRNTHLSTGFLGTPLLLPALTKIGETDLAYDLLLQKEFPGWLYSVSQGATTVWELWDGYTAEKGFSNWSMNSFNHYAYGAVVQWFYRTILGIQPLSDSPDKAGFKEFRLAPEFGKRLSHAEGFYRSAYGRIESAWKRENGRIVWNFTVPCNTSARVPASFDLPDRGFLSENGRDRLLPPGKYTATRVLK